MQNEVVDTLVVTQVKHLLVNYSDPNWIGTMSDLMSSIKKITPKQQRDLLPGSPAALRVVLNRVTNKLRSKGFGVKFGRTTDHMRTRYVKFVR